MAEKLFAEMEAMAGSSRSEKISSTNSGESTESESITEKSITDAEAGQVGELGQELEKAEASPSDRAKQLITVSIKPLVP